MARTGYSCGACKFLRRRCTRECVFASHFCYEQAASHFEAVHRVFGAGNVSKLLLHLPVQDRSKAAITISYEALARMQDPVYGCVGRIFALQQQVACLKEEIETIGNQMAANLALGVPNCASYQLPDNSPNHELAFGCNNMGLQSPRINEQSATVVNAGINARDHSQMIEQFPQATKEWEDVISQLCSDSYMSPPLIEEFEQTIYEQNLWGSN